MNIVVICPMKVELEAVLKYASSPIKKEYKYITGFQFESKLGTVFAFEASIGKTNMGFDLAYLDSIMKIDHVICLGVGGGLEKDMKPLDIVIATKVCYHDVDVRVFGKYKLGQLPGCDLYFEADKKIISKLDNFKLDLKDSKIYKGLVITGDQFATSTLMSKDLLNEFDHPICVDMESAAVGQICNRMNIPFNIIRSISDCIYNTSSHSQANMYNNFEELSSLQASKILHYLLNN